MGDGVIRAPEEREGCAAGSLTFEGTHEGGWTVKILGLLQKLGILRYGAKAAVYRDGAGRPVEFMMDDVLNAETDLVAGRPESPQAAPKKRAGRYTSHSDLSFD